MFIFAAVVESLTRIRPSLRENLIQMRALLRHKAIRDTFRDELTAYHNKQLRRIVIPRLSG